jgi:CheY-like chemotaxis protein
LGLAIVRHLVELHGGTVTAESEGAGLGATFNVDLPVRSLADTGADRPRVSAGVTSDTVGEAAAYLAGLHVVAVDDQEETRALIRAVLEARGAQVTVCSTADDTLATVARERPDVLVADIGMPQVDGYELIRRIRASQDHHAATLPSIALTAYGSEHDRARALAAGYWEHLAKPIMPSALAMAVAAVAGRKVGGE